jgi:hypothetical protein
MAVSILYKITFCDESMTSPGMDTLTDTGLVFANSLHEANELIERYYGDDIIDRLVEVSLTPIEGDSIIQFSNSKIYDMLLED